jgi:hypothetical protein
MRTAFAIGILALAMLAASLPATSFAVRTPAAPLPASGGLVFWLKSDGTHGVSSVQDFQGAPGAEDFERTEVGCSGFAPVQNACQVTGYSRFPNRGGWYAGFYFPTGPVAASGGFVGSVQMNITGSQTVLGCCWEVLDQPTSLYFTCNFYFVQVEAGMVQAGDYYCNYPDDSQGTPTGDMTVTFHAGAFDPSAPGLYGGIPGMDNSNEIGVGEYGGYLGTYTY